MSIENAILELAAAIRELAASNLATAGSPALAAAYEAAEHNKAMNKLVALDTAERELEKAVAKVETDAKAEQKKVMAAVEADRKPTTAKAAIEDALAKAKKAKDAEAAPVVEEDDPLADSTPLDYEKDVKPKLVQVGKNKQEMVDLLASFGVGKDLTYAKADMLPADKFGAVVAACDKILATRG